MQKRLSGRFWLILVLALIAGIGRFGLAAADSASSTNYKVDQTQFNSGATLNSCSSTYCARTTIGDVTAGSARSANYDVQFGLETIGLPQLEVIALGGTQNLGYLDTNHTATATTTIKVRNYLSKGYVIQLIGSAPNQGTHTITSIPVPSTSHPGAEQFGVNMVGNTAPKLGADPVGGKSNASIGTPTIDYSTANLFKYNDGDIVAASDSSDSETVYTLSMIINVSSGTAVGHYTAALSAVVVPTY